MGILTEAMVSAPIADQNSRSSRRFGLVEAINRSLQLLKRHLP